MRHLKELALHSNLILSFAQRDIRTRYKQTAFGAAGTIMGMRQAEIDAKLERSIAFPEIGTFSDTPINYYPSGMEVRLGFSVAAHINPDILLRTSRHGAR